MNSLTKNNLFFGLFFLFASSLMSCGDQEKTPPYYELIAKDAENSGKSYGHYIYVGGDYERGFQAYQDFACHYYYITKSAYPISSISFVTSSKGSKKGDTNINKELRKDILIAFVYDYKKEIEQGKECPALRSVFVNKFHGVIKKNK